MREGIDMSRDVDVLLASRESTVIQLADWLVEQGACPPEKVEALRLLALNWHLMVVMVTTVGKHGSYDSSYRPYARKGVKEITGWKLTQTWDLLEESIVNARQRARYSVTGNRPFEWYNSEA